MAHHPPRHPPATAHCPRRRRGPRRGNQGVDACLATLVGIAVTEIRAAGLHAETVDADRLPEVVAGVLERVGAGGRAAWVQSWRALTGPVWSHRTHVVTRGPEQAATALLGTVTGADGALTVAAEVRPGRDHTPLVRVLARASGRRIGDLDRVTHDLTRAQGVTTRTATGEQLTALRATTPLGAGRPPRAPLLETWWAADPAGLDSLAPVTGGVAVAVGHRRDGTSLGLDLVSARPRRVVAVGEGWLAASLVGRAAAAGAAVIVETRQPAPWQALAASAPAGAEVLVGAPGTGRGPLTDPHADPTEPAAARRPALLVEDVAGAPDAGLNPRAWQTVLQVVPRVAPETRAALGAADLVLVAPGAGDRDDLAEAIGLAPASAADLPLGPGGAAGLEVAVVAGGRIEVVQADPRH